jgi:FkbM family methyltransferase
MKSMIREFAASYGLNISRQSENPMHTFLGLPSFPIHSILDVGANTGQFARIARNHFPYARIFSFEPIPEAYQTLSRWVKEDGNAAAFQVALGDVNSLADIQVHQDHTPSSSLLPTTLLSHELFPQTVTQHKLEIHIRRGDEFITELGPALEDEILLKLDVQGFEAHVLRGAEKILKRARACIVEINVAQFYEGQSDFFDICELVNIAGMKYAGNLSQTYAKDGHVLYFDAIFQR